MKKLQLKITYKVDKEKKIKYNKIVIELGGIQMMKNKDKFPTMIIDGEIIDLNTASEEKLEKLQEKLEQMQEEIRNKIDKILEE